MFKPDTIISWDMEKFPHRYPHPLRHSSVIHGHATFGHTCSTMYPGTTGIRCSRGPSHHGRDPYLVCHAQQTLVHATQLCLWPGLDRPLHLNGNRVVPCRFPRVGEKTRKDWGAFFCSPARGKPRMVSPLLRVAIPPRRSCRYLPAACADYRNYRGILPGVKTCRRIASSIPCLGLHRHVPECWSRAPELK